MRPSERCIDVESTALAAHRPADPGTTARSARFPRFAPEAAARAHYIHASCGRQGNTMKNILIVAVLAAIGLVGCGGGGGGGAAVTAAAPTVTITAANQASVARAIVDGGQAFGTSQPFAATGGGATEQSAGATRAALHTGALQSVVRRGLAAAFAPQRIATIAAATRPTATTGTTELCAVSGSVTTAVLDADGSQSLSNGDVLTITFNQCNDSDAVMSGVMSFTLSNVTSAVADN